MSTFTIIFVFNTVLMVDIKTQRQKDANYALWDVRHVLEILLMIVSHAIT